MEILHFEYLGDTECRLAANAVLVLGEYQISISTYLRAVSQGGIHFFLNALNIFWVGELKSSGGTGGGRGGGDAKTIISPKTSLVIAKTIISPNTSFGDIII